jgi:hypothetical protein
MGITKQVFSCQSAKKIDRTQLRVLTATSRDYTHEMVERDRHCLEDLRATDPRDDKKRIERPRAAC